jgi:PAP2 superfamily
VPTPGFNSLPSGHATHAFMVARLLRVLAGDGATGNDTEFDRMLQTTALGIAINRERAGVHFPADSTSARVLGRALADYVLLCARDEGKGSLLPRVFDGLDYYQSSHRRDAGPDADARYMNEDKFIAELPPGDPIAVDWSDTLDGCLHQMWTRAAREWR